VDKLWAVTKNLTARFPNGNQPFMIVTRLAEECGELAAEVNHWEGTGVKHQKHGEPNREHLAKEIYDVIRSALQIAQYYGVEGEVEAYVNKAYERTQ
jgi:NTP pyrophosphatase (non-canonical NTP hydrolase)